MKRIALRFVLIVTPLLFLCCQEEIPRRYLLHSGQPVPVNDNTVSIVTNIVDDQGSGVEIVGYCWSTDRTPTIKDDTTLYRFNGFEFTGVAKLLEVGKEYHVRAYAIDDRGLLHYGNEIIFLNDFVPSFTVTKLDAITDLYFQVTTEVNLRNKSITKYGHAWSTEPLPTIHGSHTEYESDLVDQQFEFSSQLEDLTKDTKYFIRPYCETKWGVIYGNQISINVPKELITGRWQEVVMPELEYATYHYLGVQIDRSIYFFTGNDGSYDSNQYPDLTGFSNQFYKDAVRFDWVTKKIDTLKTFPGSKRILTRGFNLDDKIYVGFGLNNFDPPKANFDMWEYNITSNAWRTRRGIPITSGRVINCISQGGYGWALVDKYSSWELWQYDARANSWTKKITAAASTTPTWFTHAIAASDDFIYFGCNGKIVSYQVSSNQWEVIRSATSLCLFLQGGNLFSIEADSRVYKWSGSGTEWKEKSSIPLARSLAIGEWSIHVPQEVIRYTEGDYVIIGIRHVPNYAEYLPDPMIWFRYTDQ